MAQWKEGDVVQLKSGGPLMTVANAEKPKSLYCQWFNSAFELKGDFFNPDALKEHTTR